MDVGRGRVGGRGGGEGRREGWRGKDQGRREGWRGKDQGRREGWRGKDQGRKGQIGNYCIKRNQVYFKNNHEYSAW